MPETKPALAAIQEWMSVFMQHSIHKFIHFAKEKNVSMSQIGALIFIHHKGKCGVSDIGHELGISNAAASQMLDRMVQQELIERTEDARDRRAKKIVLNEKGRKILQESFAARFGWVEELTSSLSPQEQEQTAQTLGLLTEKVRKLSPTFKHADKEESSSTQKEKDL